MLSDNMNIEIFVFEDQLHDLTYVVEDDRYLQRFFDIYDMKLDLHDDLIHVHVNQSICKQRKYIRNLSQ
jgi:hypothetical protein